MNYEEILYFWFNELKPRDWYRKDSVIDARIVERFSVVHQAAKAGLLYKWRETAQGALAEILVLDQFSRNMFRDNADAFAQDALALVLAQEALRRGLDQLVQEQQRHFFYLPFEHSEAVAMQEESVRLFTLLGQAEGLDYAKRHKQIIDRFGRFPHRNKILGRQSTAEEVKFLQQPGSSF
ncbi:MAG: DUF924 family protein [Pseudomonadota bacterium]